jgi:hypothetical protein
MALNSPAARQPATARKTGYVIAVLVNTAMLYLVNVQPGWQVLPFLTDGIVDVLGLVNLSLAAGIVVNAFYLVDDRPVVRSAGELTATGIALVVLIRLLQVFPFDFGGWATVGPIQMSFVVRLALVVVAVAAVLGMIVHFVSLIRAIVSGDVGADRGAITR